MPCRAGLVEQLRGWRCCSGMAAEPQRQELTNSEYGVGGSTFKEASYEYFQKRSAVPLFAPCGCELVVLCVEEPHEVLLL